MLPAAKKRYTRALIRSLLVFVVTFLVLYPPLHQSAGNLFFGKIPLLYNVTLAQFFFTQSAHPLIGNPAPYAHYQLSRTYFIQGKLDEAIAEAKQELAAYPENKRTHYILGLAYGYANREEEAIENFQRFIEWKPDTWAARNDKAWLEFRIGRIDEALKTITPVRHLHENPWVQNTYGVLLMNKGLYEEAKAALHRAEYLSENMTPVSWGIAYPGNDPRVYEMGLSAMRSSIKTNLSLLQQREK